VAESKIQAETRTEFGKGAARRIRRADKVPAVLYGHGAAPTHISLPGHETMLALKHGGSNALLTIEIGDTSQLALPKDIQRDPIKGFLEHIDLIVVTKGEKVIVDIPVHVIGQPAPETLVVTEYNSVSVEAEATHIPEYVEVSVEGAAVGTQILARDLVLPKGSMIQLLDDTLVVHVVAQQSAEALEEELAEAEAEAGIERDETEAEVPEVGEGDEAPTEGDEKSE